MKVAVIGTGGCGVNIVTKLIGNHDPGMYEVNEIQFSGIDTSTSNIVDEIVEFTVVGSGTGSGKVRSENWAAIRAGIPKLISKDFDLTVIVSSTSGGSGALIADVATTELLKHGKAVIRVLVTDTRSFTNIQNTKKVFDSLSSISGNKYYIPVMIYDNLNGRSGVDEVLHFDLEQLIATFNNDYTELDDTDKLNFVQLKTPGVFSLGVYKGEILKPIDTVNFAENKVAVPVDGLVRSVLAINNSGDLPLCVRANADYIGLAVEPKYHAVLLNGVKLSKDYLIYLSDVLNDFRNLEEGETDISIIDTMENDMGDIIV